VQNTPLPNSTLLKYNQEKIFWQCRKHKYLQTLLSYRIENGLLKQK
jgi:hypothetical protein